MSRTSANPDRTAALGETHATDAGARPSVHRGARLERRGLGWYVTFIAIAAVLFVGIWIATTIWVLYRLIRGYMLFNESKPIPGM